MSFLDNLTAKVPFIAKTSEAEYFFALNIGPEKLTTAVWTIEHNRMKILGLASGKYSKEEEIVEITDKLLDEALGGAAFEPEKILFGVSDSWLQDDNLKEPYLKLLRQLVKDLEVKPMAYVSTSHAIAHFLEKEENSPPTAILVGIGDKHVRVIVLKAGRVEGSKTLERGHELGLDTQNALLTFSHIEVLPSKILIFGAPEGELNKYKSDLLSFPWMSKLSFLHLPRVDLITNNIEIKAVTLAGAVEINPDVKYDHSVDDSLKDGTHTHPLLEAVDIEEKGKQENVIDEKDSKLEDKTSGMNLENSSVNPSGSIKKEDISETEKEQDKDLNEEDFGFGTGDVLERSPEVTDDEEDKPKEVYLNENISSVPSEFDEEVEDDYRHSEVMPTDPKINNNLMSNSSESITKKIGKFPTTFLRPLFMGRGVLLGAVVIIALLVAGYIFLPKSNVIVYIEPRILEKDAQVIADPGVKEVDEQNKKIPGQVVDTQVSGTEIGTATGKKKIGDPAKGVVRVYNATNNSVSLKAGQTLVTDNGIQFKLDTNVQIASKSGSAAVSPSQSETTGVTAVAIGADGNIPSQVELKVGNFDKSDVVAKTEGNLSGGTSKEVTVVTDADQKKLLASLTSELKKKAKEELQAKLQDKKVLEEAFTEEVVKKSYNKNINDQANDFTLNLTLKLNGLAIVEDDLETIVAKLVETNVPENFVLNIAESETRADVSKVEKDGKVVFLARFRAKLIPRIDTEGIKSQLKGKTPEQAAEILKNYENVLGSDISISPALPGPLQRLSFLEKNISVQISQK